MVCNDHREPEDLRAGDLDIDGTRRQLKWWVVERSIACAAIVFVLALVFTNGPFPFGPNYLLAALIAGAAAAMVGILLAARAYLQIQRILAERTGSTLWYRMGRQLRAKVAKRTSR
jgi:hypothetical protein